MNPYARIIVIVVINIPCSVPVLGLFWYPFCQPLVDIREYFGEKIALHAAWLGHYTYYLVYPAAVSLLILLISSFYSPVTFVYTVYTDKLYLS